MIVCDRELEPIGSCVRSICNNKLVEPIRTSEGRDEYLPDLGSCRIIRGLRSE